MEAEDKWLNFNRYDLQQCFSQTIPLVSPQQHSCIAPTATCLLGSSACSTGKLLPWRPHVSHPHRAVPWSSGQGQTSPAGSRRNLSPLRFLPAAEGALRAAVPSWPAGRAFSSCPAATWSAGSGSSPRRQGPSAPTGQIPVPVCGNTHGTSSPASSSLLTQVQELTATGKARTSDSSEMGLYGVYCSKHFIILQWNVLWSAKYYC